MKKESKAKKENILNKLLENKLFHKINEKTIITKCITFLIAINYCTNN